MAPSPTTTTTTTAHLKSQKPKRRRPPKNPSSSHLSPDYPITQPDPDPNLITHFSPTRPPISHIMDDDNNNNNSNSNRIPHYYDAVFTKFNSALTAGLLNPMSPPPPPIDKHPPRSSPTLFEMMSNEPDYSNPRPISNPPATTVVVPRPQPPILMTMMMSAQERSHIVQERADEMIRSRSSRYSDWGSSDVRVTLTGNDGVSVKLDVHRAVLVGNSRFFVGKLKEEGEVGKEGEGMKLEVEIRDCDDVEVYAKTIGLMYGEDDLRRRLMKEDVCKVLGILKVSAAIGFDAGVLSCLEYLEAAPWAEDEEEKVASLLSELRLEGIGTSEVLKRVSLDIMAPAEKTGNDNEEVLIKLLNVVLEGRDEKARREMKGLVSKMLRENTLHNDLRKESLYSACDGCLQQLRHRFLLAAAHDLQDVGQIAKQADNLHWILDILIDRLIAEEFLKTWASQTEMSSVHSKVPPVHRYEVSGVTARLFVGIGKGQLIASKEARCSLLKTWLVPFYDDFGWMRRASKGLDRHLIEDGLSNTILTLPLAWQQELLLAWFDRFLNSGDDCPNIQRGFEVWWRRAFWKRNGEPERPRVLITTVENS